MQSTLHCFYLLRKFVLKDSVLENESFVMSQRALRCHVDDNTPARYWFAPVRLSCGRLFGQQSSFQQEATP